MITEDKVKKAWQEYYDYKERHFGGPGNGCDDYRDIPDEVFKKKRELEEKARKLQKEYNESQHFVDNDVFKFRISLNRDFIDEEITIYTKPFSDFHIGEYKSEELVQKFYDAQEDLVQEKYFTQKKIDELKLKLIQKIQECKNPFYICCVDRDGGYNVAKEQLFNID